MGLFSFLFGTTYKDKKGYLRFTDSNNSVHRWSAAKKLGRKLRRGEVVHHKDRNKTNNSWANLHVFRNQRDHDRAHKYDAKRFGNSFSYKGRRKSKGFWMDWF